MRKYMSRVRRDNQGYTMGVGGSYFREVREDFSNERTYAQSSE